MLGCGHLRRRVQRGGRARSSPTASEVWADAEIVVKVKEPIEPEYGRMREGQIFFTYLHLAPLPELTRALLERKVTGIAYETIEREPTARCRCSRR